MNPFGIGTDLVEVARIAGAIERQGDAFLRKVFTAGEREYCDSRSHPAIHYAARFAAKEAAAKALGTGIGARAGLLELEVVREDSGAPAIRLSGNALGFARSQGITRILISLTHTRDHAAAHAIAVRDAG